MILLPSFANLLVRLYCILELEKAVNFLIRSVFYYKSRGPTDGAEGKAKRSTTIISQLSSGWIVIRNPVTCRDIRFQPESLSQREKTSESTQEWIRGFDCYCSSSAPPASFLVSRLAFCFISPFRFLHSRNRSQYLKKLKCSVVSGFCSRIVGVVGGHGQS